MQISTTRRKEQDAEIRCRNPLQDAEYRSSASVTADPAVEAGEDGGEDGEVVQKVDFAGLQEWFTKQSHDPKSAVLGFLIIIPTRL